MAQASNAILAINSLDRCIGGATNQPLGNAVRAIFDQTAPPCNNFSIQSPGALIYGYINKIIVSQIQLQYNVPTILPGKNDNLWIFKSGFPTTVYADITIPFGFYTPTELAGVLQTLILNSNVGSDCPKFTVVYDIATNQFVFSSNTEFWTFYFPTFAELELLNGIYTQSQYQNNLKLYNLLGMSKLNTDNFTSVGSEVQYSTNSINFLYTPFVDIVSETLTKYQLIKDTDTSAQKLNSIVARIYLTGVGIPEAVNGEPIGSRPFTLVQDLNSPKVIRWSPDEAVNTLDFALYDQYGDLLFSVEPVPLVVFNTEFQMTLLCIEKERY